MVQKGASTPPFNDRDCACSRNQMNQNQVCLHLVFCTAIIIASGNMTEKNC